MASSSCQPLRQRSRERERQREGERGALQKASRSCSFSSAHGGARRAGRSEDKAVAFVRWRSSTIWRARKWHRPDEQQSSTSPNTQSREPLCRPSSPTSATAAPLQCVPAFCQPNRHRSCVGPFSTRAPSASQGSRARFSAPPQKLHCFWGVPNFHLQTKTTFLPQLGVPTWL